MKCHFVFIKGCFTAAFSFSTLFYAFGYSALASSNMAVPDQTNSTNRQLQRRLPQQATFETNDLLDVETNTPILTCLLLNEENSATQRIIERSSAIQPNINSRKKGRQSIEWAPRALADRTCQIQSRNN